MARHNKNMKSKNQTPQKKGGPTASRISEIRKSPANQLLNGGRVTSGNAGNRKESLPQKYKPMDPSKALRRDSALDYQRALDEQILDDRRRKEAEKEKEAADELNFMRAVRGGGYDGDMREKAKNDFTRENQRDNHNGYEYDAVDSIDQLKRSMNHEPVAKAPQRSRLQSDASNDPRFPPMKDDSPTYRTDYPGDRGDYIAPNSPLARALNAAPPLGAAMGGGPGYHPAENNNNLR